ncbi:cyclophilin-like fold protein [Acinetobacter venetianus]|uniref:cyclophilin-like fold protein n=1 Tax=Acinetobacter venetianus TaxID=52133 RepID=UPI0032B13BC4
MEIQLIFEETTLSARLDDTVAARSFYDSLPLELTLTDYASTEKISDLAKALPVQSEPKGYQPKAGDITYYAPWGNLAIFYKNFGYASGLVRLGEISDDIQLLRKSGLLNVWIEATQ